MKYLLLWFSIFSPPPIGNHVPGFTYNTTFIGTEECCTVYDTKDACMETLKRSIDLTIDPTRGVCIPVNGFTRELKAY